jgi:hypothetical protein
MEKLNINYNGFRAKTINVRTFTGSDKFELQKSNELGLPKGSIVVGFMAREHSKDKTSSNGKSLVASEVFENAYLSIKIHKPGEPISLLLDTYYLPDVVDKTILCEPTKSEYFDWNNSFISINDRVFPDLVDGNVIELVVLYQPFIENRCTLPSSFNFRTGVSLLGTRRATKFLPLLINQEEYPLSNTTNIGIPRGAWIVGFSTLDNPFPLKGEPMNNDSYDSAYLTLKRKTDCFIENLPIELVDYQDVLFSNVNYFPIEPVNVLEIDWPNSILKIKKNTAAVTGQVFQFTLIYVMADNNDLLTTSGPIAPLG